MVGANYTGGRRNAAKARSKDTTGRLQRGHFSKQRLGILTDALRSTRPDRSRPSAGSDDPNLTSNPRPGYATCTPPATVYDISLVHAKRDLAQKKLWRGPFSPPLQPGQPYPDPRVRNDSPTLMSPPSPQTLLPETASAAIPSFATPSSPPYSLPQPSPHPEPASPRTPLPRKQPTPTAKTPPKLRSKILDLIDNSDREHILSCGFLGTPRYVPIPHTSPFVYTHIRPPFTLQTTLSVPPVPNLSPSLITALVLILLP